jgi:hypothetical protein
MKNTCYQESLFEGGPVIVATDDSPPKAPKPKKNTASLSPAELSRQIIERSREYPESHPEKTKMKEQLQDLNARYKLGIEIDKIFQMQHNAKPNDTTGLPKPVEMQSLAPVNDTSESGVFENDVRFSKDELMKIRKEKNRDVIDKLYMVKKIFNGEII